MNDPCVEELQDASFKGVPFFVSSDKEGYGRRIVSHEYPNRNKPYHEDMGAKYASFSVTAYVLTIDDKTTLCSLFDQSGEPGLLILPAVAPLMCVGVTADVERDKDKQGYFSIKLELRRAGESMPGPFSSAIFEVLIGNLAGAMSVVLSAVAGTIRAGSGVLDYVSIEASETLADVGGLSVNAIESYTAVDSDLTAAITRDAYGLIDDSASASKTSPENQNLGFVSRVGSLVEKVGTSLRPNDALLAMAPFVGYSRGETAPNIPTSISETSRANNAKVLSGIVRTYGLIYWARAAAASTFATRAEAIQVRADLAEAFSAQMQEWMDEAVIGQMADARDYAIKALSKQITDIAPIAVVTSSVSLPALYWAYRLYSDPNRAGELVERNDVFDPSFMPSSFEARTE